MKLENSVAIVTGAAGGIGKAIGVDLAEHGCTPVLIDVKSEPLQRALEEVRRRAPAATAEACDISDRDQVRKAVQSIRQNHGRIDILVNNAGMMIVKLFSDMPDEEVRRQMDINYFGPVAFVREVVPVMESQGSGVILNVASVGARLVVPGTGPYAASKAAVHAFSEALYYELKDRGIHVGIVIPGGIKTGIFERSETRLGEYYRDECKTPPSAVTNSIRQAIEKERFKTVVPFSANFLLLAHAGLGGIFRNSLLKRLRPYMQ